MTIARAKLIDLDVTPWYHCISECVRGAFLLDTPSDERKVFLERRLKELSEIFSVGVCGYGIMDTHMHLLVRLDGRSHKRWTKKEVLQRWAKLYPPRGADRKPLKSIKRWLKDKMSDHKFVSEIRWRLANLGWFMKSLKEPIARVANRQDGCRGHFWASRYKSIAVLDSEALLATCVYIDLNPLAAGKVELPEQAEFTSLHQRIEYCRQRNMLGELKKMRELMTTDVQAARCLEEGIWLCPIEGNCEDRFNRTGLHEGFTIVHYLRLVDATSRLVRDGKQSVDWATPSLFDRLQIKAHQWQVAMDALFTRQPSWGVTFSLHKDCLREAAAARGCRILPNLNACPAD